MGSTASAVESATNSNEKGVSSTRGDDEDNNNKVDIQTCTDVSKEKPAKKKPKLQVNEQLHIKDDGKSLETKNEESKTGTTKTMVNIVGSIKDEFQDVPNNPIWLNIAMMLDDDERERIFPNIPELKGIERLAEAMVESRRVIEYIDRKVQLCKGYFFFEHNNMEKLFPGGIKKLVEDLNDRSKATRPEDYVPLPLETITEDDSPIWVVLKTEMNRRTSMINQKNRMILERNYNYFDHFFRDRLEQAMEEKDQSLYDIKQPIRHLDYKTKNGKHTKENLWFNWGADKAGFGSKEKFIEFCTLAGIKDPSNPIVDLPRSYVSEYFEDVRSYIWISDDRKVLIQSSCDAYRSGGYCHYFGCTGLRSRGKFLFEWFKENGKCGGYCWNGRNFI